MNGQEAAAGKWQTVKSKQPDVKKKARGPEPAAGRIETTDSVFSALDNWYDAKQGSQTSHQKPAESSDLPETDGKAGASSPSDAGSSTGESSMPKAPDIPKRVKKPKAKQAKITPSQAASGLGRQQSQRNSVFCPANISQQSAVPAANSGRSPSENVSDIRAAFQQAPE